MLINLKSYWFNYIIPVIDIHVPSVMNIIFEIYIQVRDVY